MPFVQVNDVKLHYEMEGSGLPRRMIGGTGLPGATWRTGPSAQYAAEGFTVITRPPAPRSTTPPAACSTAETLFSRQVGGDGYSNGSKTIEAAVEDSPQRLKRRAEAR